MPPFASRAGAMPVPGKLQDTCPVFANYIDDSVNIKMRRRDIRASDGRVPHCSCPGQAAAVVSSPFINNVSSGKTCEEKPL